MTAEPPVDAHPPCDCDRCRRPLRTVRWEMYATKSARDAAQRMYGDRPIQVLTAGYVGTYGGICYHRQRAMRREAGAGAWRRVVRVVRR